MSDKRLDILRKLEDGEISSAEALGMLNQQPPTHDRQERQERQERKREKRNHRHEEESGSLFDGVFSWVTDMFSNIGEAINEFEFEYDVDEGSGSRFKSYKGTVNHYAIVNQGIEKLTLIGKNDKVEVKGYGGNEIRIECTYNSKRDNPEILFEEYNGEYKLIYDEKLFRSVKIICEVPHVKIKEALIASKNDRVVLEKIKAEKLLVSSKNDSIKLNDITAYELIAQTKNASIKAKNVSANNIHLETTNDSISVELIEADEAVLKTSNASVKTDNIDVTNLRISTTNAGLKLYTSERWDKEQILTANTTNGNISLHLPRSAGIKLEAGTTFGKISCENEDVVFTEYSKTRAIGETRNYYSSGMSLDAKLYSTNANVRIKDL